MVVELLEPAHILSEANYLNITSLDRFINLKQLWIIGNERFYILHGCPSSMLPVQHLHIYIFISFNTGIGKAFLSRFNKLQTLDLRSHDSTAFTCPSFINWIPSQDLRHISIRHTDVPARKMYNVSCNFDDMDAAKSRHVTYLDLSRSHHVQFFGNWFNAFPELQLLDLSYNDLLISELLPGSGFRQYAAWILFLLFHPHIEVMSVAYQGMQFGEESLISSFEDHTRFRRSIELSEEALQKGIERRFGNQVP